MTEVRLRGLKPNLQFPGITRRVQIDLQIGNRSAKILIHPDQLKSKEFSCNQLDFRLIRAEKQIVTTSSKKKSSCLQSI